MREMEQSPVARLKGVRSLSGRNVIAWLLDIPEKRIGPALDQLADYIAESTSGILSR